MIGFRNRKIQEIGNALWVSLPVEWTKHHQLKPGDLIRPVLHEGDKLLLEPCRGEEHD